jgi:hypothetical protein
MSSDDSLQHVYANSMRQHPFGFALYHPSDKDLLKLGSCGYFNDLGDWNPITNVSADDNKYVAIEEELQKADPQELSWGPKCSDHVTEHREKMKTEMCLHVATGLTAGQFQESQATSMYFANMRVTRDLEQFCSRRHLS